MSMHPEGRPVPVTRTLEVILVPAHDLMLDDRAVRLGPIRPNEPQFEGSMQWICPACEALLIHYANEQFIVKQIQCYRCRAWLRTRGAGQTQNL